MLFQSDASQTPSSCRQRIMGDLQPEGTNDVSGGGDLHAMESGYSPVPTSSSVKLQSTV